MLIRRLSVTFEELIDDVVDEQGKLQFLLVDPLERALLSMERSSSKYLRCLSKIDAKEISSLKVLLVYLAKLEIDMMKGNYPQTLVVWKLMSSYQGDKGIHIILSKLMKLNKIKILIAEPDDAGMPILRNWTTTSS